MFQLGRGGIITKANPKVLPAKVEIIIRKPKPLHQHQSQGDSDHALCSAQTYHAHSQWVAPYNWYPVRYKVKLDHLQHESLCSTSHRRLIITKGDPGFETAPVLQSDSVTFKAPTVIHESKLQVSCGESDIFVAGNVRLAKIAQIPVMLKADQLVSGSMRSALNGSVEIVIAFQGTLNAYIWHFSDSFGLGG